MRGCTQVTLNPEELRRMQLIELDILSEFDRICTKHNIKYIIDSGTLLGAVRHKGFIPWDDDIDVSMLRSEYEKFCKICESEIDSTKYFFQNHDTDPEYRWTYGKILRKDTVFVRLGQEHMKMKRGVFIDIFPMDGIPKRHFFWSIYMGIAYCCRKILWSEVGKVRIEKAGKRLWFKILNLIPEKVPFGIMKLLSKRVEAEHVDCLAFGYKKCYTKPLKREYYTEREQIEFEGRKFWAPKDADGWLKTRYDDYMQLPPVEERKGNADASYFDLGSFEVGEEKAI